MDFDIVRSHPNIYANHNVPLQLIRLIIKIKNLRDALLYDYCLYDIIDYFYDYLMY
jgi:hypothetical protein